MGSDFEAGRGSVVNISGGDFANFDAFNSEVNISGGSFGNGFQPAANSEVNLFGRTFFIDGVSLEGSLSTNSAFTVLDREATLSGVLEDGSLFSFDLNSTFQGSQEDQFPSTVTLTVTLVESPANELLGDVNRDGVVDFFDIAPFIAILTNQAFQFEADIDGDQDVDFFDIAPFIALLAGQGP